ncbi:DUF305 domain-containing protein [uncultured Cohaesibacter sp.]|uniref:DUF305 domain-containing protein n=1 Tax=uncultured Cohaesibacter sp. TaxID=1002546 RepID=UPI0029C671AB|nr:DUF305 domain-containing protein [uncultured Cohaesibacter sp.]
MRYVQLIVTIGVSTAVMLGLMYLNTYSIDHVFWSETRLYMALVMGSAMTIVMLSFMSGMYQNRLLNLAVFAASLVVFAVSLYLVRSQTTIDSTAYMRAMIPHHSIAIMTSERAGIEDVRVQQLASGISETQRKEIREMEWLIDDIEANGVARTTTEAAIRPVPTFATETPFEIKPELNNVKGEIVAYVR